MIESVIGDRDREARRRVKSCTKLVVLVVLVWIPCLTWFSWRLIMHDNTILLGELKHLKRYDHR